MAPSPIPLHETVSANFPFALETVVRPARLGWVFSAPVDVRFAGNSVVLPDVGSVRRERLAIVGPSEINGSPAPLAEVLPPSTRGRDLGAKKDLMLDSAFRGTGCSTPSGGTRPLLPSPTATTKGSRGDRGSPARQR